MTYEEGNPAGHWRGAEGWQGEHYHTPMTLTCYDKVKMYVNLVINVKGTKARGNTEEGRGVTSWRRAQRPGPRQGCAHRASWQAPRGAWRGMPAEALLPQANLPSRWLCQRGTAWWAQSRRCFQSAGIGAHWDAWHSPSVQIVLVTQNCNTVRFDAFEFSEGCNLFRRFCNHLHWTSLLSQG